jgi:hypothetical protein
MLGSNPVAMTIKYTVYPNDAYGDDHSGKVSYWSTIWWAGFLVASVADLLTTYLAVVRNYGEDNPVVAAVIESYGFPGFVGLKILGIGLIYVLLYYAGEWKPKLHIYLPALCAIVSGLAAVTNILAVVIFA